MMSLRLNIGAIIWVKLTDGDPPIVGKVVAVEGDEIRVIHQQKVSVPSTNTNYSLPYDEKTISADIGVIPEHINRETISKWHHATYSDLQRCPTIFCNSAEDFEKLTISLFTGEDGTCKGNGDNCSSK